MNASEARSLDLPVVLVTGASAGLGLALARQLAGQGFRRILTARRESLGRFAAEGIHEDDITHIRPLDICSARDRGALMAELEERWGGVDILINNAGIAYRSVLEHWDEAAWQEITETNVLGPCELIRLALPSMRQRRSGRILNVSSVGGMMAMPTMSLYSAAKFALEGATEALWYEVRPWGIHVTLIEPGFIHSDSFRNTRFTVRSFRGAMTEEDPYHHQYQYLASFIERMMDRAHATPESVAKRIVQILRDPNPPLRQYATVDAHLFAAMRRILPRSWYHALLYRLLPHVRAGIAAGTPNATEPRPGPLPRLPK